MNLRPKLFSRRIDQAFLNNVYSSMRYSPDIAYLQQFERQLVFIPDTWMTGHIDHDRICNEELVYPTAFTHNQYSMVYKPLGVESYPIVMEVDKHVEDKKTWTDPNRATIRNKQAVVRGQVWSVVPASFLKLDKVRENGVVFERKRVVIDIPLHHTQNGDTKYCVSTADDELLVFNHRGEKVYVQIPLVANLRIHQKKMWMYVGVKDYWKDMLAHEDGDKRGFELPSCRIMRPRSTLLKDYFYWLRDGETYKQVSNK